MDLPTFLVIIFLLHGEFYQEVNLVATKQLCEQLVPQIPEKLFKALKGDVPQLYHASCVTLKPYTSDT